MKKLLVISSLMFALMFAVVPAQASVGSFFSNFPKAAVAVARIGTDGLEYGTGKLAYVFDKVAVGSAKLDSAADEYVEGQPTFDANAKKAAAKRAAKAARKAARRSARATGNK